MANLLDKLHDWAMHHPNESMGEYYVRALCGLMCLYVLLGLFAGGVAAFFFIITLAGCK